MKNLKSICRKNFKSSLGAIGIILFLYIYVPISNTQIENIDTQSSGKSENKITHLKSGYAPLNGLQLYYEIYGSGQPVILLHGAYMTINLNWNQLIPAVAKTTVINPFLDK
jgi:hypothetical protein